MRRPPRANLSFGAARSFACGLLALSALALGAGVDLRADEARLPVSRARSESAAANSACEGCHEAIAEEWRASLHHRSYTDPVFQAALAIEPLAFCRGCHAPEGDPAAVTEEAGALGVACVTCHVRNGEVLGGRALPAAENRHAVRFDAGLKTVEVCAACHQFDFPGHPGAPMQSTLDEHAASKYASENCQSCHMLPTTGRDGTRHFRHDFRVVGDPAMLASAVHVSARRGAYGTVDVVLTPARVGHAFPTGDMFRHLIVRATAKDAKGKAIMVADPVVLGRRFALSKHSGGSIDRVPVGDDRVPPPRPGKAEGNERVATLRFPDAVEGLEVSWEVFYRRTDAVLGAALGLSADEDETLVARGALQAP